MDNKRGGFSQRIKPWLEMIEKEAQRDRETERRGKKPH
jgi:hypothetical protein